MLTALTGKALPGELPLIKWTPPMRVVVEIAAFVISLAAALLLLQLPKGFWTLLLLAWLFTIRSVRVFQTGVVHHASHGMLFQNSRINDFFGELVSVLTLTHPLAEYRKGHMHHHAKVATTDDPDLAFMVQVCGLEPGLSIPEYWRRFWLSLLSPRFHALFLRARLRANFVRSSRPRRLAAIAWVSTLLILTAVTNQWTALVLAYVLPVGILSQMSAWVGLLGLHQWVRLGEGESSSKEVMASVTSGRFVGVCAPDSGLNGFKAVIAWNCWLARILLVDLPYRIAIIPGDLPSHDFHHWHPKTPQWATAAYARRDAVLSDAGRLPEYTEYWGIKAPIQETFRRLSELPRTANLGSPLTYSEQEEVVLSM